MRTYEVRGTNKATGRKKTRRYNAKNEDDLAPMLEADYVVVDTVEELKPGPPTEAQLELAERRGIDIPSDATVVDASDLISAHFERDKLALPHIHAHAASYGVETRKYMGKKAIFEAIFHELDQPGREVDLAAWFAFRVYRTLVKGRPDGEIQDPQDTRLLEIAKTLASDASVMRSVRRYDPKHLIWFGTYTAPDGAVYEGGSNRTIAYKKAAELLAPFVSARPARVPKASPQVYNSPKRRSGLVTGFVVFVLFVAWVVVMMSLADWASSW